MYTYEPMAGENIKITARNMVAIASAERITVVVKFNNIEIKANPGDKPNSIVKYYKAKLKHSKT